jgi:hypothetical protein
MNPKIIIIIIAIITSALFSLTAGCGGNGNLRVSVTDTDGNSLWGAKVVSES